MIRSRFFCLALFGLLPAIFLAPASADAQSCILTRLDSPVLNAFDPAFDPAAQDKPWEVTYAWRYGQANRHFVGTDEQEHRRAEGSEVINDVHLLDLAVSYNFDTRNSLSVSIPYLMAEREGPIRDDQRQLIGRQVRSNTRGIGDLSVTYHRLLWDPKERPGSNISLSIGLKLPTGENSAHDSLLVYRDGELVTEVRTADQSVQAGDGGFGLVLQASGYTFLGNKNTWAAYLTGTYIVAPETDSGVLTYRSRDGEQVMSIADQYVARTGIQVAPAAWKGFGLGIGARIEGIPVHDLVGSSEGFRRPGYILSAEPALSWTRGLNTFRLSLPIAVERNRQPSVSDLRNNHHGDASFPDYLVLASFSHRF